MASTPSTDSGDSVVLLPTSIVAESTVTSSLMKLSDVLKSKREGAKRGAVGAQKSKTYAKETPPSASPAGCSIDGHDYLKSGTSASSRAGSTEGARFNFGFPMAGHSSEEASNNGTPTSTISCAAEAAKATNFLANLNPARWSRTHHNQASNTSCSNTHTCSSSSPSLLPNVPKSLSNPQLAGNREKIKTWIRDQATLFLSTYFSPVATETGESNNGQSGDGSGGPASGLSVLSELTRLVKRLEGDSESADETLEQIRAIVADSNVSSFEILHIDLVRSLLKYLTEVSGPGRNHLLRFFLHVGYFLKSTPIELIILKVYIYHFRSFFMCHQPVSSQHRKQAHIY